MHVSYIVYLILRVILEKFIKDIQSLMLIDSQNLTIIDNNTLEIKIPKGISYMDRVLKDLPKGVFIDKQDIALRYGSNHHSVNKAMEELIDRKVITPYNYYKNQYSVDTKVFVGFVNGITKWIIVRNIIMEI